MNRALNPRFRIENRDRILASLGENPDAAAIAQKVNDLEGLVRSAIGFSEDRGDLVKVSLVEFLPGELASAGDSQGGVASFLSLHFGTIINAVGLILGMLILSLMGVKPLIRFLSPKQDEAAAEDGGMGDVFGSDSDTILGGGGDLAGAGALPGMADMDFSGGGMLDELGAPMGGGMGSMDGPDGMSMSDIEARENRLKEQLAEIVEQNDERAAYVIRQWLQGDDELKPA